MDLRITCSRYKAVIEAVSDVGTKFIRDNFKFDRREPACVIVDRDHLEDLTAMFIAHGIDYEETP